MAEEQEKIPFEEVLDQLLNADQMLPVNLIFRFSDLIQEESNILKDSWLRIPAERRLGLLQDMEMITEENLIVNFDTISLIALSDPVSENRETALRCLWESEDPAFIPILLEMLDEEDNIRVKAQIIHTLGKFLNLGETGRLLESKFKAVQDRVENIYLSDQPEPLRQKALEAISNCSHDQVDNWIEKAIETNDENWLKSALYAIGNLADPKWEETVLENLDHPENTILLDAVRAAGEMGSETSKETLLDLLEHEDGEIRMAAVWSLSEIGGKGVKEVLEALREELETDDELDFLEDAIENFLFQADLKEFDMLDIFPEDVDPEENNNLN